MWEVVLVGGKGGVERWGPKPGEKKTEESCKDQKAKVNGFFSRCLQSRKEKQSPIPLIIKKKRFGRKFESKP